MTNTAPVAVPEAELRLLLSSSALAARLGVSRKAFASFVCRQGIYPDYCPEGQLRRFYDEGRYPDIRSQWVQQQSRSTFQPGLVVDARGEVAYLESVNADGIAIVRYLEPAAGTRRLQISEVHRLGSTRELARSEGISRYKLCRLLHASGIRAVHQDGKTIYYDVQHAREALKIRVEREDRAVGLDILTRRTGISKAVLAAKVRHGCIRTVDIGGVHRVDRRESDRVERVVTALQDPNWSLQALGICQLHTRGTAGSEVARWDIPALVKAAQRCTDEQRIVLFDQVAWLCHGTGRSRLRQALDSFGDSTIAREQNNGIRASCKLLLGLLSHLHGDFDEYRCRLLLIVLGTVDPFGSIEKYLHKAAEISGCATDRASYHRLRAGVERSVSLLLAGVTDLPFYQERDRALSKTNRAYADDNYVPGAVVLCSTRQKLESGVIVRVEHQAWNAMLSRWDKQLLVRFSNGERRLSACTGGYQNTLPMPIVLRAEDTRTLIEVLNGRGRVPEVLPYADFHWTDRKAS